MNFTKQIRRVHSYSWEVIDHKGRVVATGSAVTAELADEQSEQAKLEAESNWADDPMGGE